MKKSDKTIEGVTGHKFTEDENRLINEHVAEYKKRERELIIQAEINARLSKLR